MAFSFPKRRKIRKREWKWRFHSQNAISIPKNDDARPKPGMS